MKQIAALALMALVWPLAWPPAFAAEKELPGTWALIKKVLDGNTVIVEGGCRVRFYGVDAPETKQKFGPEAARFVTHLAALSGAPALALMGPPPGGTADPARWAPIEPRAAWVYWDQADEGAEILLGLMGLGG
jgi:hypothetical protein